MSIYFHKQPLSNKCSFLPTVGSLMDLRAYTLVGPPVFLPAAAPLAVYSSTTVYT